MISANTNVLIERVRVTMAAGVAALALLSGCSAPIVAFDSTGPVRGLEPLEELTVAWNPVGTRRIAGHPGIAPDVAPFEGDDPKLERAFARRFVPLLERHGARAVPPRPDVPVLLVGLVHRGGECRGPCGTFITYGGMLYRDPSRPLWTFKAEQRADRIDDPAFDKMMTAILEAMADDGLLPR